MARHPNIETCIFCDSFPCVCGIALPKKTAKKVVKKPDEQYLQVPLNQPVPPLLSVDIRAAMKAEANQGSDDTEDKKLMEFKSRWVPRDQYEAEREQALEEQRRAIVFLEPLLHPDEKRTYVDILYTPSQRAQRWRETNATQ